MLLGFETGQRSPFGSNTGRQRPVAVCIYLLLQPIGDFRILPLVFITIGSDHSLCSIAPLAPKHLFPVTTSMMKSGELILYCRRSNQ